MTKLLSLKHWQLFLLMVGLPLILEFTLMAYVFSSRGFKPIFLGFPVIMILFMIPLIGWYYSLGTNLFKRLPATAKMSLTKFRIFLFIYVAYFLFILAFICLAFVTIALDGRPNPAIFLLIIPLHFFAMFCILYCFYFNAKAMKTIELQRPVTFNDYAGEFFLLWFFPIGIWILQPRINKLVETEG